MDRERAFLLLAIAAFAVLSATLFLPFLQYVLAAVLLGYVLTPLHRRLAPRTGSRVAAISLIVLVVFAVLLPVVVLLRVIAHEAQNVVRELRAALERTTPPIEFAGFDLRVEELLGSMGGRGSVLVDRLVDVLGGLSNAAIGVTILLFLIYYLLTEGSALVRWIHHVTPLPAATQDELADRIDRLLWAVLVGNVLVALVQGVLTGIGLWVVGFPNVVFWTVLSTVVSLLPLVGASLVWLPASAYLFLIDEPARAALLFAYGALLVSASDNYLRPIIGGHEANLSPGLFVVGIFGGVVAMGFLGLFFGPVILGVLKALVEVYVDEYSPRTE